MSEFPIFDFLFLALVGLCVGSFIGLLADRWPEPLAWDRSACGVCGHGLGVRDLVPVLGWLANRGRCRFCGVAVSARYPLIELGAAVIALWSLAVVPGWLAWATCGLGWALLALALIDSRHLLLPDVITLPLVPAGLAVAWAVAPERLWEHALGAAVGYSLIAALRAAYRRLSGREGIGMGDAKLLAAAGAWIAWQGLAGVVVLAAAAGLAGHLAATLLGRSARQDQRPFGPYLAASFWLTWLYGPLVLG